MTRQDGTGERTFFNIPLPHEHDLHPGHGGHHLYLSLEDAHTGNGEREGYLTEYDVEPVTWNKGTATSAAFWVGDLVMGQGRSSPRRRAALKLPTSTCKGV